MRGGEDGAGVHEEGRGWEGKGESECGGSGTMSL